MFNVTHAGDEAVDVAVAISGEFVSGAVAVATHAASGDDESRIDYSTDEGDAFVGGLLILFFGMESKFELAAEIFFDDFDIAQKLLVFVHRYEDEKVVHIATVMFIAEVKLNIAVELVEENVREKLAGEVADDNTATLGLIEETFARWKLFPIGAFAADGNIPHGFIKNHFMPEITQGIIEALFVVGVATNAVLAVGALAMVELFV